MQFISPSTISTPKGHYSPGIIHNGIVYVAGQLPVNNNGEVQLKTIEEQTALCMHNIEQILLAANSSLQHILKVNIFVSDIASWPAINAEYSRIMGNHKPARIVVPCNPLHHGCGIEIDCIAAERKLIMNITLEDIEAAHKRIAPHIHRTPVLTSKSINEIAGNEIYFKCENFQKIGAFKIRGGMNAALMLSADKLKNGLATHSSGNHAQAIAFVAKQLGTKAYIVMPDNSPAVKVAAVKGYGAEITFCEPTQAARESTLQKIVNDTGAEFIHPYDDYRVITGQATAAKELIGDAGPFDAIVAPVGGGGLMSGTCLSTHYLSPETIIYAAEPEGAADAVLSFKSGKIEKAPFIKTIADGLQTTLSEKTLGIIKAYVKEILLVNEEEIKSALKLIYERMKIVIEPSSAVPFAAVLKNKDKFAGKKTGIILTGGNVDIAKLGEWFK